MDINWTTTIGHVRVKDEIIRGDDAKLELAMLALDLPPGIL